METESLLASWNRLMRWKRCALISSLVAPSTVFLLGHWHEHWHEHERETSSDANNC